MMQKNGYRFICVSASLLFLVGCVSAFDPEKWTQEYEEEARQRIVKFNAQHPGPFPRFSDPQIEAQRTKWEDWRFQAHVRELWELPQHDLICGIVADEILDDFRSLEESSEFDYTFSKKIVQGECESGKLNGPVVLRMVRTLQVGEEIVLDKYLYMARFNNGIADGDYFLDNRNIGKPESATSQWFGQQVNGKMHGPRSAFNESALYGERLSSMTVDTPIDAGRKRVAVYHGDKLTQETYFNKDGQPHGAQKFYSSPIIDAENTFYWLNGEQVDYETYLASEDPEAYSGLQERKVSAAVERTETHEQSNSRRGGFIWSFSSWCSCRYARRCGWPRC